MKPQAGLDIVLDVLDLSVRFATERGTVQAVSGVSFELHAGETLGIVGESGSGKSVTSLAVMGLLDPRFATVEAAVLKIGEHDARNLSERRWRGIRGRDIAMIFQDPMTALNPFLTVGRQLSEVLELHENATRRTAWSRVVAALADVGIADPDARAGAYPHELSGGMRQRVMIAMALLGKPRVLIADEPTTALDVTVQAQTLDLLRALQERHGTAILLITHSLGVVAQVCTRTSVMYAGRIVENAATPQLFERPLHPYTRGLLASVPRLDGNPYKRLVSIEGQPPSPDALPPGCAFAPRCEWRRDRCERERPEPERFVGRSSACFAAREMSGAGE